MQNRLKSKVVWVAVLLQVILVITLVNPEIADIVKIVGGALIECATVIGLLNNPTSKTSF